MERQLAQAMASRQVPTTKVQSYTDEKFQAWKQSALRLANLDSIKYEWGKGAEGADEGTEGATSEDDAVEASDEVRCLSPCFLCVN